jgi:endogenous inhibitor of DNA gyrase (YacG/DUF329 family)
MSDRPPLKERLVPCPACKSDSMYSPSNPNRPFCSLRCKQSDFGGWATESYRVPESRGKPDSIAEQNSPLD